MRLQINYLLRLKKFFNKLQHNYTGPSTKDARTKSRKIRTKCPHEQSNTRKIRTMTSAQNREKPPPPCPQNVRIGQPPCPCGHTISLKSADVRI